MYQGSAWDGMGRKKSSHGIKFSEVSHGMGLLLKNFRPMGWDDFKNFSSHPIPWDVFQKFPVPWDAWDGIVLSHAEP